MTDILDDLRAVQKLRGDTYSSMEVLGMVGRAATEIEQLRGLLHRCRVAWIEDDSDLAAEVRAALEGKP